MVMPIKYNPDMYAKAKGYINGGYESADDLMDKLMQVQERKLINGGLGKAFDSAVTRTILAGHGYHSASKVDHSSSDGSMNQQTVIILPAKDAE